MTKGFLYNISIMLDVRRKKENGKFPVKLRVYLQTNRKVKLYNTDIDLTKKEFENIWIDGSKNNLRGENRKIRIRLQKFETRANDEAEKLRLFSFEKFEKKLFRKSSDANNVIYHFQKLIDANIKKGKIGTSESFKYSLKSISSFANIFSGKEFAKIPFELINKDWLEAYEDYMLDKGKSVTSVGIYLRSLRIVFNNAIVDNDIIKEIYPFGKNKYQIPKSETVKKALNNEQLGILFNSKPKTCEQEKAKDFWFFSYTCNGMNLKDIALLKYSDIRGDKFSYYRAKTFKKSRVKSKIDIYLNDYSKGIIEKYETGDVEGYVFPILEKEDNAEISYKKIKNFTRFINQHLKKLATDINLPEEISSYYARHSFATNSIRKGATKEFISEALDHSSMEVTDNYFAGFEDDVKKEFSKTLMNFDN